MRCKRGLSTTVAVVLIILITISSIIILWTVIIPFLKDLAIFREKADLRIDTKEGYTFYDSEKRVASVAIKRGNDDANLSGVQFIFSTKGDSETYVIEKDYLPGINEARTISFLFLGFDFIYPEKVSIASLMYQSSGSGLSEISSEAELDQAVMNKVPQILFFKYWCNKGDIDKNGKLDFPGEGLGIGIRYNLVCDITHPDQWNEECCGKSIIQDLNGDGYEDLCCSGNNWCNYADIDRNGIVEVFDLSILAGEFGHNCLGPSWCSGADTNQDGVVDEFDLGTRGEYLKAAICIP